MNRRDFLRFRAPKRERVVDVSCRDLYLRYLETRVTDGAVADVAGEAASDRGASSDRFFRELFGELRDVRLLKISDRGSLTDAEFRRRLGDFVASFRAAGGNVEMRGA